MVTKFNRDNCFVWFLKQKNNTWYGLEPVSWEVRLMDHSPQGLSPFIFLFLFFTKTAKYNNKAQNPNNRCTYYAFWLSDFFRPHQKNRLMKTDMFLVTIRVGSVEQFFNMLLFVLTRPFTGRVIEFVSVIFAFSNYFFFFNELLRWLTIKNTIIFSLKIVFAWDIDSRYWLKNQ